MKTINGKEVIYIGNSGGRTSGMMAEFLMENYRDKYHLIPIFANTGWEDEKTLEFVNNCDKRWQELYGIPVIWVESVIHRFERKASTHKIVSYETATRDMTLFEEMCKKYGIPNAGYLHCTRELKENPILDYLGSVGLSSGDFYMALGMRSDEPRRLKRGGKYNKIYPLVDWHEDQPDKQDVLDYWSEMPFDLGLPEWRGNCLGCYKKSFKKLGHCYNEVPDRFETDIEEKYGHIGKNKIKGVYVDAPRTMYRGYKTNKDLITMFKEQGLGNLPNDDYGDGCSSSCEAFGDGSSED